MVPGSRSDEETRNSASTQRFNEVGETPEPSWTIRRVCEAASGPWPYISHPLPVLTTIHSGSSGTSWPYYTF